jgi:hypothetical protein
MQTRYNQSGNVSDISHHLCTYASRYLADPFEIDGPRIRRRTADQQFRPMFLLLARRNRSVGFAVTP